MGVHQGRARRGKRWLCAWLALALMAVMSGCNTPEEPPPSLPPEPVPAGYRGVCWGENAFWAVGTGGRIDRVGADGTAQPVESGTDADLHGVAGRGGLCVAVGGGGTVLVANGGAFERVTTPTDRELLAVTVFGSGCVAVGRGGTVLYAPSGDWREWTAIDVGMTQDFVSVASDGASCLAVTREGKVLTLCGDLSFTVQDYNETYKGLGTMFYMNAVCSGGGGYIVLGTAMDNPDEPVAFQTDGEIWTPMNLERINDTLSVEFWPIVPTAGAVLDDQVLVAARGGKLLTLTSCSSCTKLSTPVDVDINALAASPAGDVLLAGDGFRLHVMPKEEAKLYAIQAEQARAEQRQGSAYIIDVRTPEEYAAGHIPGALLIPVDTVADALAERIPDTGAKLIFYCAWGGRAQTALETALSMGYDRVYNLGGLDNGDWPYELETGA